MSEKVTEFIAQYDSDWIEKFIFDVFGRYRYVHAASSQGLDCYLSNIRDVYHSHPDDVGCVSFCIKTVHNETEFVSLYNMVDFRDPDVFIDTLKKYLNLKAFL